MEGAKEEFNEKFCTWPLVQWKELKFEINFCFLWAMNAYISVGLKMTTILKSGYKSITICVCLCLYFIKDAYLFFSLFSFNHSRQADNKEINIFSKLKFMHDSI